MRIFFLGLNVVDDAAICDLGVLGDFVYVDEKKVLVPCMSLIPWKIHPLPFDTPLLHLSLLGTLIRCRYYWDFSVSRQMTVLYLPGSKVISPVTWSMDAQSSSTGSTRGSGLIGVEVGVLIVATWFSIKSCPWRRLACVFYL